MTRNSESSIVAESDAELLRQFVSSHDESAFNALVLRHGPMVLGICRRILRGQSDADDAFQATFLLLALKAKQIGEPRLLGNWLFGVATRSAIGIRRSNSRRVVQEKRLMRFLPTRRRDETKDADLWMMLDEQISKLPEKLRRVIVCCHLEGLTKREAAEQLKINDSTIVERLKQARAILKRRLGARGAGLTEASLGTILVAVAVPAALSAGTVKAATLAVSGKLAVAGATTGISKGTTNALLAAKLKLAASLVAAGGLAVSGGAVVKPLVTAPAVIVPAVQVASPAPQPPRKQTPAEKKANRMRQLLLEIIMYANGHKHQPLPPNLKAVGFFDPDFEYYGQGLLNGITLKSTVAIVAEKPAPDYKGPILVGFVDGHVELLPQAQALGIIKRSQNVIQAAAAGQKPSLAPTTRNAPQVPLPLEIRSSLVHNAEAVAPLDVSWTKTGFVTGATASTDKKRLGNTPKPVDRRVIWQSGKWYDWTKGANGKVSESVFDGTGFSQVMLTKPPSVETWPVDELFSEDVQAEMGYLDRAGIHLPNNRPEMKARVATSVILEKLSAGAILTAVGSSSADGHPCVRLTVIGENIDGPLADRTFIYDLDPSMNYVIRHEEELLEQRLQQTTENDQFQQLQDKRVWLPHQSVSRYFNRTDDAAPQPEIVFGERFEVTDFKQQAAADDQFVLKGPPASAVETETASAITPGGDTTAHVGVLAGVQPVSSPELESASWRWIVAGVAGIAALFVALIGFRRYARVADR